MKCIVSDTIGFLSKTFPKIYSSLYLEYLKQYSATYDVNKTQLRALMFIRNYGAISMTDLCAKLNIEKGSLTSMVDDLTKKGYVVRTKDLSDRRKYLIIITEKGTMLASDFMGKLSNKLEEKLFKLDQEDQHKYMEAINTLQYILNKEEFN
ncbi:MAG: MarR family winged helix-turn-helix transcriptional regulator [Romboutsia sp.]|uniref:MarR family winged helix-turn-helix transcriptional regulator n=1 Tax=Romboutsia sp. TaxID=1965302 RepID=UPI003F3BCD80